jgi:hypothetical protein
MSFNWISLKLLLSVTENKTNPIVNASHSVINVENPVANVSIPFEVAQIASTAFSTAAGMRLGLVLANKIPGLGAKAVVLLGTTIAAQAVNILANKM